jgi:hypothetical protein
MIRYSKLHVLFKTNDKYSKLHVLFNSNDKVQ